MWRHQRRLIKQMTHTLRLNFIAHHPRHVFSF
jgi:hypothetical protein